MFWDSKCSRLAMHSFQIENHVAVLFKVKIYPFYAF